MDWEKIVLYIGIPALIFIIRFFMNRIDSLENKIINKVSESAVRTIIDDKLDPLKVSITEIKEDISEIKQMLNKMSDRRQ